MWARASNIDVLDIYPPIHDEVVPFTIEDAQSKIVFDFHREEYERPQCLVVLSNTWVRDEVGLVFLADGSVCEQGNWFLPYILEHAAYRAYFRRRRLMDGDVFLLLGMFSEGFFHWFHDTLPRLLNSLPHLPANVKYLIHSQPRPYQLESLKALGIDKERLIYQSRKGDMVCERLWFATPPGNSVFGGGATLRDLASRLKAAYGVGSQGQEGRLYVSRGKASRRVLNEEQIIPLLEERGFKVILMEDLSFEEQVHICAGSTILIGPHGAGLTNLLYCNADSIIGEIAVEGVFPFYLGMARQMGHNYQRFTSEKADGQDMTVDVGKFGKWLDSLLAI